MRLKRKGLVWTAYIEAYPFGACRAVTREMARRRAIARARHLRRGALRALLHAYQQGTIRTVL